MIKALLDHGFSLIILFSKTWFHSSKVFGLSISVWYISHIEDHSWQNTATVDPKINIFEVWHFFSKNLRIKISYYWSKVNVVLYNQKICISGQSHADKKIPTQNLFRSFFKSKYFEFVLYEQWLVFALLWRWRIFEKR